MSTGIWSQPYGAIHYCGLMRPVSCRKRRAVLRCGDAIMGRVHSAGF